MGMGRGNRGGRGVSCLGLGLGLRGVDAAF
jgi:hypothetical protein